MNIKILKKYIFLSGIYASSAALLKAGGFLLSLWMARSLEVSVHPALNELKFPAGLSQVDKITIADTTCTKIEGFKMISTKDVEITNNIYLKTLSLGNMTSAGNILVSANSPALNLDVCIA